jgi:hypothetical protein
MFIRIQIGSDLLQLHVKYQYHNTADELYSLKSLFLFLLHPKCVREFDRKLIVESFQI